MFVPPDVEVDRSRAGLLRIAPPVLGWLLRLPEGHCVAAVRVTLGGDLEVLIEGADMPPRGADGAVAPAVLICRDEEEPSDTGPPRRRTLVHWRHAPERAWVLFG